MRKSNVFIKTNLIIFSISEADFNNKMKSFYFNFNARGETTNAVMNSNTYSYYFDDIGNRTTSSVNSVISTYTANQLNQYTAVRTNGIYRSISHDKDGNLRYDGYWTYSWNAENRPIDIYHSLYHATNDEIRVQMKYDYRNRRVERKITKFRMTEQIAITPFVDGVWDAVRTHKYIWDGWNIAAEIIIDHVNPATNITYYTWGLDLSGTLQGAGDVSGLLAATVSTPSTASTYYAFADANGNITEYVDDTGAVKAHYEYNACGEITAQSGTLADDFTHRFSSKPYDPVTRLVQYEQRPYDPVFNRWLSRDPIGIKGGLNEFEFVVNDAVNKTDYLGEFVIAPVGDSPSANYIDKHNKKWIKDIYAGVFIILSDSDRGRMPNGGMLVHGKRVTINLTDSKGKTVVNDTQAVTKRVTLDSYGVGRGGRSDKEGQRWAPNHPATGDYIGEIPPIYFNLLARKIGRCVKGEIIIKANWYLFNTKNFQDTMGFPGDVLSGSNDHTPRHGSIGSRPGWPSVDGSYVAAGSYYVKIMLSESSPYINVTPYANPLWKGVYINRETRNAGDYTTEW